MAPADVELGAIIMSPCQLPLLAAETSKPPPRPLFDKKHVLHVGRVDYGGEYQADFCLIIISLGSVFQLFFVVG